MRPLLTVPEAAALLRVSASTVRRRVHDGTLTNYGLGRAILLSAAQVAEVTGNQPEAS